MIDVIKKSIFCNDTDNMIMINDTYNMIMINDIII